MRMMIIFTLSSETKKFNNGDAKLVQDIKMKDKSGKKHKSLRCGAGHEYEGVERMLGELSRQRLLQVPTEPVNLKVKLHVIMNSV
jgi:hypothetical protein